jgi:hypothetical protein
MSDRNDNSSLQNMFAQVLREIQSGIGRLEQNMNQAAQNQARPDEGGFPPPPPEAPRQSQPAPKAPAAPYTGQRWEYKVVYVNFRGQISSEGEQIIIGRGERRSTFVRQYLDEIGQEGWELSGVSPLGDTENSYFVFKRPATGDRPTSTNAKQRGSQRIPIEEVDESGSGPVAEV